MFDRIIMTASRRDTHRQPAGVMTKRSDFSRVLRATRAASTHLALPRVRVNLVDSCGGPVRGQHVFQDSDRP
jgi:hypothetical protein